MGKIKILAFIAMFAILFACGSQDGGPPELEKLHLGYVSPFDTLVVKFNSSIVDIDKLDTNIIGNVTLVPPTKTTDKELRFVGKNKTQGGFSYFDEDSSNEIEFKNLKNTDGYVKQQTTAYFSTYPIFDSEVNTNSNNLNNTEADANDIPRNLESGVTFAGIIDKEIKQSTEGTIYDFDDYYKLNLKAGDSINITASNRSTPFSFRFYGPCNSNKSNCNDTTMSITQKTGTLQETIKYGHLNGTDSVGTLVPFYIHVFDKDGSTGPNPYLITVKVIR